jgi:hypothetical protein
MSDGLEEAGAAMRNATSSSELAISMLRFAVAALEQELAAGVDTERQEELRIHIQSHRLTIRRLARQRLN